MSEVRKVVGTVGMFNKAEAIAVVCRALNNNADVLKDLIAKVDCLENEVKQVKNSKENKDE